MSWSRATALIVGLAFLGACGFEPLHGERASGASTVADMSRVKIELINERMGQELRNELFNRLNPDGRSTAPRYSLKVVLNVGESAVSIEKDDTASRSNLSVNATYTLYSLPDGKPVMQGVSTGLKSYGIITNSYATLVARSDALKLSLTSVADDIATRVALYFRRPAPTP